MKKAVFFGSLLVMLLILLLGCTALEETKQSNELEVFFCPADDCADQLIQKIDGAEESVHVAIYSFTLDSVSDALAEAHEKGVEVKIVFDEQQAGNQYSEDEKLEQEGIFVKRKKPVMHNKFTIIDREIVCTGSFNYSQNADTSNNENLLCFEDIGVALEYELEFQKLWEASE